MRLFSLPRWRVLAACILATALAAACGGGGGGGSSPAARAAASAEVAGICTPDAMKQFTRAYLNENYLWYAEMPPVNAADYPRIDDYFYSLLSPLLDPTGQPKDRFSFIASTRDADSLMTGSNIGYGVRWEADTQGRQRVAFVDAASPALAAGLARGGELVRVLTPDASWFPNAPATISFVYRTAPGAQTSTVTLQSAAVQEDPVPLVRTLASPAGRKVDYLLFNAHTDGAQDKLIAAIQAAQSAGVQDVVLDLRYNGGGYLYPALTLSSMLAGGAADGQVFEQLRFNDKRQAETDASVLRFSGAVQFGEAGSPEGTPLPRLGLPRVFLLTGGGTCSASESIVNSLRGVGIQVVIIGKPTCGKPYGFSRRDNCGFSYFPIEFQGVNALGSGDYASGFAPTCDMADDFDHALGAPAERLLSAALVYADTGACPAPGAAAPMSARPPAAPLRWPLLRGKVFAPTVAG